MLLLLLGGLVCLSYTPVTMGQDPDFGTHELTGPVRVLWETRWDAWSAANWPNSIDVSPSGDIVYVLGPGPMAFNATTGIEIWWSPITLANDYVQASPDGITLFSTGGGVFGIPVPPEVWIMLHAFNATTGDSLWWQQHRSTGEERWSVSPVVSPDGMTLFFTAYAGELCRTTALEASTGSEFWEADRCGSSITVSPDGSLVVITGESATEAFDSTIGDVVWTAGARGEVVVVHPDGSKVFVAGESGTVALDSTTGQRIWVAPFKISAGNDDPISLAVSADGDTVVATGKRRTVAYDSTNGNKLWLAPFEGGPGDEEAASLAVSSDGNVVFVAGKSSGPDGGEDYITIAYNATNGAEIWTARYDGTAAGLDRVTGIVASPDGPTVYVTGKSEGIGTDYDIVTIAYELKRGPRPRPGDE
jgi:outer membrane protein assembly factor BamB